MCRATGRVTDEVTRLDGCYAHVHGESIGAKHDDAAGEAWLHGTFTYVIYAAGTPAAVLTT